MQKYLWIALMVLIAACGNNAEEEPNIALKEELTQRLEYMILQDSLQEYFQLTDEGIEIKAQRNATKPETIIYYSELDAFKSMCYWMSRDSLLEIYRGKGFKTLEELGYGEYMNASLPLLEYGTDSLPLEGIRIMLDPGHVGGSMDMAVLEDRYMKSREFSPIINFNEGNLAWWTAQMLKDSLESKGASVGVTRELGLSAFGISFSEWLDTRYDEAVEEEFTAGRLTIQQAQYYSKEASKLAKFKFFRSLDFRERARIINEFEPDLTVVIHYNAHPPPSKPDSIYTVLTDENYSMAFIGGGFGADELSTVEKRLDFLRLWLTDDQQVSSAFSAMVLDQFEQVLNIKPVEKDKDLFYLKKYSKLAGQPGVYARNLALTRMIKGPICYGEPLIQNNRLEIELLNDKSILVGEYRVPNRCKETAWAYQRAIETFFGILPSDIEEPVAKKETGDTTSPE